MNAYESVESSDGEGIKRLVREGMKALIELEETKLFMKQIAWELEAVERSEIIDRIKEMKRRAKNLIADCEAIALYKELYKIEDSSQVAKQMEMQCKSESKIGTTVKVGH